MTIELLLTRPVCVLLSHVLTWYTTVAKAYRLDTDCDHYRFVFQRERYCLLGIHTRNAYILIVLNDLISN